MILTNSTHRKLQILAILVLFTLNCFSQQKKQVYISGYAYNFNNGVLVEDKSEFESLTIKNGERLFIPDSNRFFSVRFELNAPNYFRIGRNIFYLSAGDSINAVLDYNDPMKAIFKGTHSVENTYLKGTPFPKGGSYLEAGDGIKSNIPLTIEGILDNERERNLELNKIKPQINPEFYRLEMVRNKADVMNSLEMLKGYYTSINKIPNNQLKEISQQIDIAINPYLKKYAVGMLDIRNLKLVVYRDVYSFIEKYINSTQKIPHQFKDWIAGEIIKSKALQFENKDSILALKKLIPSIKTKAYQTALNETINELTKLNIEDQAQEILLTSIDGVKLSLSNFKNKVIYLEFWATWCGPCIEDKPYVEKLINELKDNEDIVILSISIDEDKAAWKKYLQKKDIYKHEYLVNRNFMPDYHIVSVPRMILIDKYFRIVNLNAPSPRSKDLKSKLIELSK